MKFLSIVLISLFVMSAHAETVLPIQAKELKVVRVKCPPQKICPAVVRTKLVATYIAYGCLDEVKVSAEETHSGERPVLILTARNHVNPRSAKVKCVAPPFRRFEFKLPSGVLSLDDIEVIEE